VRHSEWTLAGAEENLIDWDAQGVGNGCVEIRNRQRVLDYFIRAFKRMTGTTPKAYRCKNL